MKLNKLHTLHKLSGIAQTPHITQLIKSKITYYPSNLDIICLAVDINLIGMQILRGQRKAKKDITVHTCIKESLRLYKVADDYENKFISCKEINQLKKDFNVKTK